MKTWLMLLTVYLACLVIDPGHVGLDTERRLHITHWLWAPVPSLMETDTPEDHLYDNIAIGVNGQAHYGYGIAQSLVMLPGDVLGTLIARAVLKTEAARHDLEIRIRRITVAYLTFPLIGLLTALVLRRFFAVLGLTESAAIGATLLSFVATRWFDVSESYQETGLHFLCVLAGILSLLRWRNTGNAAFAWGADAAFFVLVLIRVVTIVDAALFCSGFAVLMLAERGPRIWRNLLAGYARIAACLAAGLAVDRLYHFIRFGEWTSTYAGLFFKRVAEARARSPQPLVGAYNDPAFPWTTPFRDGVVAAFVSPEWGVVWFDSVAVLAIFLLARFWSSWDRLVRIVVGTTIAYLLAYTMFYARYYEPAGWAAWGDRYLEVPAILLSVLGVFMLFRTWHVQTVWDRAVSLALVGSATLVQLASGVFDSTLELQQLNRGCGSHWIIWQRFSNIAAYLTGGRPPADCVPAAVQWMWDPHVLPGALARTVTRTVSERQMLWSVWALGLIVALALAGWLVVLLQQSWPANQPDPARAHDA